MIAIKTVSKKSARFDCRYPLSCLGYFLPNSLSHDRCDRLEKHLERLKSRQVVLHWHQNRPWEVARNRVWDLRWVYGISMPRHRTHTHTHTHTPTSQIGKHCAADATSAAVVAPLSRSTTNASARFRTGNVHVALVELLKNKPIRIHTEPSSKMFRATVAAIRSWRTPLVAPSSPTQPLAG